MSILLDERELPQELDVSQSVEMAYSGELAEVASKLQRGLPVLIECDKDLAPWLKDALINRDRNLRLQYLAGLGSHLYQSGPIYAEMLAFRQLPQDLFVGSESLKRAVLAGIEAAGGTGQ